MNIKLIIPLSIFTLLAALGCQRQVAPIELGDELRVSAQIAGQQTKASKTAFAKNDKFGMWVVAYTTTDATTPANDVRGTFRPYGNYFDNVCYTMGESEFTPAESIYYPSPFVKVDLFGVTPYDAMMSNRTDNSMPDPTKYSWAVKDNQTVADSVVASDLMSTLFYGAKSGLTPALLFRHRLAKVNINVTVPETFQGYKVLALKSVEVVNTKLKATVNLTDTTTGSIKPVLVTGNNVAKNIVACKLTSPAASAINGLYTWEAIVIPQEIVATSTILQIVLVLDVLGDMPVTATTEVTFEYIQGKQSTYEVMIEDKGTLTLGSPTIQNWGSTGSVAVDARRAARMIFSATNEKDALAALGINKVKLAIDDTTYVSEVVQVDQQLICTYMEPKYRKGDKIKGVTFQKDDQVVTPQSMNPSIPGTGLIIKGDPTKHDYSEVMSIVTF